tara:strand:+ start:202 stop:549 length:348 start_codon:yes stop_codon:yes gene_type:complete
MSLLEILDSINNFNGGENSIKMSGGTVLGDILAGSILNLGAIGTLGTFSFVIIISLIIIIWTIIRVLNCPGFSTLIKLFLILLILFVPIPFKTFIILILTYILQSCKKIPQITNI